MGANIERDKLKTRKDKLAGYFFDISKLSFGAMVDEHGHNGQPLGIVGETQRFSGIDNKIGEHPEILLPDGQNIPVIVAGLIVAPIEHRSFWVLHQVSPVRAPKQSARISQLHWLGRSDKLRPDDGPHQLRHFAVHPQECIRQQLWYIAVALVDVRVGQSAACGQSPRRETLDALRRYKVKCGALELVLQLLF